MTDLTDTAISPEKPAKRKGYNTGQKVSVKRKRDQDISNMMSSLQQMHEGSSASMVKQMQVSTQASAQAILQVG